MSYDKYSYYGKTGSAADVLEHATLAAIGLLMLPAVLVLALIDALR